MYSVFSIHWDLAVVMHNIAIKSLNKILEHFNIGITLNLYIRSLLDLNKFIWFLGNHFSQNMLFCEKWKAGDKDVLVCS